MPHSESLDITHALCCLSAHLPARPFARSPARPPARPLARRPAGLPAHNSTLTSRLSGKLADQVHQVEDADCCRWRRGEENFRNTAIAAGVCAAGPGGVIGLSGQIKRPVTLSPKLVRSTTMWIFIYIIYQAILGLTIDLFDSTDTSHSNLNER